MNTTGTALSPVELAQLRTMLNQQLGFRTEQLAALARTDDAGPLGSNDDEVTASLVAGARAALRDVRAALARMGEGSYGRCTRCTAPLGRERLEILPQTAMCMPCQRGAVPVAAGVQHVVGSDAGWGTGRAAAPAAGNGRAEG